MAGEGGHEGMQTQAAAGPPELGKLARGCRGAAL